MKYGQLDPKTTNKIKTQKGTTMEACKVTRYSTLTPVRHALQERRFALNTTQNIMVRFEGKLKLHMYIYTRVPPWKDRSASDRLEELLSLNYTLYQLGIYYSSLHCYIVRGQRFRMRPKIGCHHVSFKLAWHRYVHSVSSRASGCKCTLAVVKDRRFSLFPSPYICRSFSSGKRNRFNTYFVFSCISFLRQSGFTKKKLRRTI